MGGCKIKPTPPWGSPHPCGRLTVMFHMEQLASVNGNEPGSTAWTLHYNSYT